ncbi:hypothetical protein [Streptomyces sp. MI02-7b]|uniref:hypothetical protein n=1 Tax=Streptomyces sp. MI02-7b TaxID=462941 RepID=UPI0029B07A6E|nr:hypothetical protein [Streptomyces sp. MI02-7b]MDX3075853.1 hypothetical protein [Streptomyces sp. MI02-7b]
MQDYQTRTWLPTAHELGLANGLARTHWSEHSLRAALRGAPSAVADGRLGGVLNLAVQALSQTPAAATDDTLLHVRVLVDALTSAYLP